MPPSSSCSNRTCKQLQITKPNFLISIIIGIIIVHSLPSFPGIEWPVLPLHLVDRQGVQDEEGIDELLLGVGVLEIQPYTAEGQTGDAGKGKSTECASTVKTTRLGG